MPTYKDTTFCTAKNCGNLECHRNMNRPDFQPGDQLVAMCNFKWKCAEFKDKKSMKYEKYLKQIADSAATGLYWCGRHADTAKDKQYGDSNIFRMVGFVEHCLFSIYWQAKKGAWMREAVKVPRKFVEESRRTTALAVLNEWNKNKLEETK